MEEIGLAVNTDNLLGTKSIITSHGGANNEHIQTYFVEFTGQFQTYALTIQKFRK